LLGFRARNQSTQRRTTGILTITTINDGCARGWAFDQQSNAFSLIDTVLVAR
jgi:hypothetical protein